MQAPQPVRVWLLAGVHPCPGGVTLWEILLHGRKHMESTTIVSKRLTEKHEPLLHILRPLALPLLVCFNIYSLYWVTYSITISFFSLISIWLIFHNSLCNFFYLLFPLHSLIFCFGGVLYCHFLLALLFSVTCNWARHFIYDWGSITLSASSRCLTPQEPSFISASANH